MWKRYESMSCLQHYQGQRLNIENPHLWATHVDFLTKINYKMNEIKIYKSLKIALDFFYFPLNFCRSFLANMWSFFCIKQ